MASNQEPRSTPLVVVIAGPNGAGKSTTAPALLRGSLAVAEFVNADTIAQGLSAFRPEAVAVTAGRIMLARLRALADARQDFLRDHAGGAQFRAVAHRPARQWLPCPLRFPLAPQPRARPGPRGRAGATRWSPCTI